MKWAAELITPAQITLLWVFFGFLPLVVVAWRKGVIHTGSDAALATFLFVMAVLATAFYYFAMITNSRISLQRSSLISCLLLKMQILTVVVPVVSRLAGRDFAALSTISPSRRRPIFKARALLDSCAELNRIEASYNHGQAANGYRKAAKSPPG